MVFNPSRRAVAMMRQAISPRLAIRTLANRRASFGQFGEAIG